MSNARISGIGTDVQILVNQLALNRTVRLAELVDTVWEVCAMVLLKFGVERRIVTPGGTRRGGCESRTPPIPDTFFLPTKKGTPYRYPIHRTPTQQRHLPPPAREFESPQTRPLGTRNEAVKDCPNVLQQPTYSTMRKSP